MLFDHPGESPGHRLCLQTKRLTDRVLGVEGHLPENRHRDPISHLARQPFAKPIVDPIRFIDPGNNARITAGQRASGHRVTDITNVRHQP